MNKTIMLVEDNQKVQEFNKKMLESEGYIVVTVNTLSAAREELKQKTPDIIVLDIGMPDGSGVDFLNEIRKRLSVPVLMLSGYNQSEDIVKCFQVGCDDYLTKPYSFDVLLVRLEKLLKNAKQSTELIKKGKLVLNTLQGKAFVSGQDLFLTQKNFVLLCLFVQNEDGELTPEQIYDFVWGEEAIINLKAIVNEVSRLRKKIVNSGYVISSVYGGGYRFEKC